MRSPGFGTIRQLFETEISGKKPIDMNDFLPTQIITGEQIRAARAMLRMDQKQFAAMTHLTLGTVRRLERTPGPVTAAAGLLDAMRFALETAGIELIDAGLYQGVGGPGVRFKGEPVADEDVIDFEQAVEEIEEKALPDAS